MREQGIGPKVANCVVLWIWNSFVVASLTVIGNVIFASLAGALLFKDDSLQEAAAGCSA